MAEPWPRYCSIADLGRMLVILHGTHAPSDALLKKWSAAGEFRACRATGDESAAGEDDVPAKRAPGRPGLQLLTDKAGARVYELWPQLADAEPKAVFEEAVARTVRQLSSAIGPLVSDRPTPASPETQPTSERTTAWQTRMEQTLGALAQDVKDLRREMAQFSAMRNNLITRLDEVVARSREAMLAAGRSDGTGGADPIVEARRDRDMALIKSSMEQILGALERMEGQRAP